jgi:glycosyltransferase involved in cell wall biosynthesis
MVSAIIPAYNAARTLRACIESALAQSCAELEVIVVDDGSKDDTARIARGMPGVRLIQQENAGPATARNRGIEAAKGEWLAFLDADEAWLDAEKIDLQLACARRHGASLVGVSGRRGVEHKVGFRRFLLGNPLATSTVLAKKDRVLAAGGFEAGRYYSEDYLLWMRIAAQGGKTALAGVGRNRDLAGKGAFGGGGLSSNLEKMQKGEEYNFRALFAERALAASELGNLLSYILALSVSRLKYYKRLLVRAARILRGS